MLGNIYYKYSYNYNYLFQENVGVIH